MHAVRRTPPWFAIAILVAGAFALFANLACREHPAAPATSSPGDPVSTGRGHAPGVDVPQFRRIEMDQVGSDLRIQFAVDPRRPDELRYDPMRPGGWSFQLFLDTDQEPTGYWLGYDFLTRDTEADLDGRSLRVRRTIALGAPGADGWGEETAVVPVHVNRSMLSFRVPLAAITDHDGCIDFALEMYRTSACDACPGGRSYDFAYSLFGTSDPHGRSLTVHRSERGGHYAREAPVQAAPGQSLESSGRPSAGPSATSVNPAGSR